MRRRCGEAPCRRGSGPADELEFCAGASGVRWGGARGGEGSTRKSRRESKSVRNLPPIKAQKKFPAGNRRRARRPAPAIEPPNSIPN